MIINLSIKNFYSIRDEAVLDFVAEEKGHMQTMNNNLIEFNDDKFIKVIGIFGSNAAGKSNIIKAMEWCRQFILTSHINADANKIDYIPFKFSTNLPTEFAISFVLNNIEYEYSFALLNHKIVKEELFHYPNKRRAKVFERDESGYYTFGKGVISRTREIIISTSPHTLFLSQAASMNREIARNIVSFFRYQVIIGIPSNNPLNRIAPKFNEYKPYLLQALSVCDSDIVDMSISDDIRGQPRLSTYHRINPTIPFDFATEESDGTKRLLNILLIIIENLNNDVTFILDEFDLKLHVLLAEFLIDIIQRSLKAQLVFTSHNSNLINLPQLRREQIMFVNKCNDGNSEFAALSDFSGVGKNTDLQKAYLQGRFNSIPYVGEPFSAFESNQNDETAQIK